MFIFKLESVSCLCLCADFLFQLLLIKKSNKSQQQSGASGRQSEGDHLQVTHITSELRDESSREVEN